jgi:hypothetical protein
MHRSFLGGLIIDCRTDDLDLPHPRVSKIQIQAGHPLGPRQHAVSLREGATENHGRWLVPRSGFRQRNIAKRGVVRRNSHGRS